MSKGPRKKKPQFKVGVHLVKLIEQAVESLSCSFVQNI